MSLLQYQSVKAKEEQDAIGLDNTEDGEDATKRLRIDCANKEDFLAILQDFLDVQATMLHTHYKLNQKNT